MPVVAGPGAGSRRRTRIRCDASGRRLLPCRATAGGGLPDRSARRKSRAASYSHAEFAAEAATAAWADRSGEQAAESKRVCARHPLPADEFVARTDTHLLPACKAVVSKTLSLPDAPTPRSGPQGEFAQCLSTLLRNPPDSRR